MRLRSRSRSRRSSDQWMKPGKEISSEKMQVLEPGAVGVAEVGAGAEGPLRMRCCVAMATELRLRKERSRIKRLRQEVQEAR